ncbi:sortase [Corynebacterium sp. HMSC074A09]|uniref:sortase n=1 Tax=Corynebacterium sp. HMSC074A09 TaxID=1739311 RepID=UPI0008A101F3|nr:sortase [Corynebacterium sp. HMSC074A09]OFK70238.1 hypothetical protein HMPREF2807_00220 [Corynebacterium sp. HMSC074A09]
MDSRYSARRDSYRLPEEGIRIDLRAERARRRSRSSYGRAGAVAKQQPHRPRRRSNQVTARHRKPSDSRGLHLVAIVAVVLVGIIAALKLNQEPDTPAPQPTEVVTEPAAIIEPSPAVEMYIPTIDVRADFEEGSCRVKDDKINPDSMNKACTYTAEDKPYSLPGTDSPDIVVIAGHTGAGVPAVFNNLYDGRADEHKAAVGDKLYLRTQNSGEQWLVYTATDLHDPSKEGLEQDESIWGADAKPGRLLTISCIQPANPLAAAVRNAVVGWQFEGVTTAPETAPQN